MIHVSYHQARSHDALLTDLIFFSHECKVTVWPPVLVGSSISRKALPSETEAG